MIMSVVAAKIWYLKNVRFLLGHPVLEMLIALRFYLRFTCSYLLSLRSTQRFFLTMSFSHACS